MGTRGKTLNVIFDGPPGPEAGRFVEVEDLHGNSVTFGTWQEDQRTGLWRLGPIHTFNDACLVKCSPGEPIFVLRGRDMLAPVIVREWAGMAYRGGLPDAKYIEAMDCADSMEAWPRRKMPD